MSVFYDHLLNLSELDRELEGLILEHHEKEQLLAMVDSALHHAVMDTILTELPSSEHEKFLRDFAISPHESAHLDYLITYSPQIETKIREKARATRDKFKKEIAKVKKAKKG